MGSFGSSGDPKEAATPPRLTILRLFFAFVYKIYKQKRPNARSPHASAVAPKLQRHSLVGAPGGGWGAFAGDAAADEPPLPDDDTPDDDDPEPPPELLHCDNWLLLAQSDRLDHACWLRRGEPWNSVSPFIPW
eukprot:1182097-Prorocentrum_minimum.AAC.6